MHEVCAQITTGLHTYLLVCWLRDTVLLAPSGTFLRMRSDLQGE
jgi:hypothetical protein